MTYFNTISKKIVYFAIWGAMCISLSLMAGSLYIYLSSWGPVNNEFLVGPCVSLFVFAFINFSGAYLGYLGLWYQFQRKGVFTHKSILSGYIAIQAACIGVEIWFFVEAAKIITDFQTISDTIGQGRSIPYHPFETYPSNVFNNLFFGSAGICMAVRTYPFWSFVQNHCPAAISKANCIRCFPFSVSNCAADQNTCYSSPNQAGFTCPYSICRKPLLDYFVSQIGAIEECAIGLIAFQCFVIILVAILIVHHEVKIDFRRRSIVKRTEKPKTLGRKRKTMAANEKAMQEAMNVVKNLPKYKNVPKDAPRTPESTTSKKAFQHLDV